MMPSALLRLWHSPTATTWGSLAVRLSAALLILPLVLVRFSTADVALWQLFSTLFLLALMLDMGLAPTFTRLLAYARGGATVAEMALMHARVSHGAQRPADPTVATALLSTMRWLYPRMAAFTLLLLGLLGTWGLVKPIAQSAAQTQAWIAWALVLSTTGLVMWGSGYAAALQGMNRVADLRRWEVATGLGQIASSAAVLLFEGGLLTLVAVYQAWAVAGALRNRFLLKHLHPELFSTRPMRHPEVLAVMWPAAWRSGVGVLMSQGLIQASGVVYSQLAPAAEVAAYLLALRLMLLISQFCQAPFYSKLPRLAELHAAGNHILQMQLAQRGMRLAYWVFVAGALAVALTVEPLLRLIGSRTNFVPTGVWAVMALAFFAERFGAMHLQLYSLTNRIVWHIANGVTGVIMVGLASILYSRIGPYAFPVAMLLAYAGFYGVYSATHSRRAFQLRLLCFESSTAGPAAIALCAGLGLSLYFPIHF